MNSKQLWNSHQRHKLLWAKASRDILKIRVLEMAFPRVFKRCFPPRIPCCFVRIHVSLETMPSQAFQDIAQFKRFTGQGLNLFEYAFNFIQNWERKGMLYNFIRRCLFFLAVMAEGDESEDGQLAGGFGRLPALIDSPESYGSIINVINIQCTETHIFMLF